MSEVEVRTVSYEVNGAPFEGRLLYPAEGKPDRALLMAPNFYGVSDAAEKLARERVGERNVILVLDPYGVEVRPTSAGEAAEAMGAIRNDNAALRARLWAALAVLREEAGKLGVAEDRVAVFGFCFGGACALELARDGAHIRAAASFHGLLETPEPEQSGPIRGPVLVMNGADDPMVSAEAIAAFKVEMDNAGADWTFINYGGAVHSFTDPNASNPGTSEYNAKVARRAFAAMDDLFDEVFAD
ncbi:dienelactone hydrolase family protein [Alloalcanivorax xenomutans]|uniref:dienelactone hydrolase family protein n=1 Tax=Alloalcanivorax xenomutans TaxID=1094342 RepID=UPI003BAB40E2